MGIKKLIQAFPYWVPTVLWMGVIYYLSSLPDDITPGRHVMPDKILHAAEYFILAYLILFALQRTTSLKFLSSFRIVVISGALYALSDEIHQLYVATRNCDYADLIADICGIVILFFLLWLLRRAGNWGNTAFNLLSGKGSDY